MDGDVCVAFQTGTDKEESRRMQQVEAVNSVTVSSYNKWKWP